MVGARLYFFVDAELPLLPALLPEPLLPELVPPLMVAPALPVPVEPDIWLEPEPDEPLLPLEPPMLSLEPAPLPPWPCPPLRVERQPLKSSENFL